MPFFLKHTFKESVSSDKRKPFTYKMGKTDNYMDYENNKLHTYKLQWEKLHNSNYSK